MKHIVVDLEMNPIRHNPEARRISKLETIEIGAVMLDDNYREVSSFRTYVKPEYNTGIAPNITQLTGITNEMVENAPKFAEAFRMFTLWCLGTSEDVEIYAWSSSDYDQVFREIILKDYPISPDEEVLLNTEWIDFQKEFDGHMGFEHQIALSLAREMAGIDFTGRQHDALDDARNTAELFVIYNNKELFNRTLKRIEEVMKPKPFSTTIGSMFDLSKFAVA